MNDSLWSGLLDDFKTLRDLQKGNDLRSVLIEFASPELIAIGETNIPSEHYPEKWAKTWFKSLIEQRTVTDPRPESQRIYKQLVFLYRDRHQIFQDEENNPLLPERMQTIKKRLVDSIEMAGRELLNHSGADTLPDEIAGINNNISAWLLFLHYIGKPDRKTWKRVSRLAFMAQVFINSTPPEERERRRNEELETLLMEPMTESKLANAFEISVGEMREKLSNMEGTKRDGKRWQIPAKEYPFNESVTHQETEEFDFGPPNMDTFDIVGQFTFGPLPENSYSEIKDITAASIEAIRRIKDGLLSPDQEEKSSKTDQELKLLSNANEWANLCLECISWISTKLEWLSEQFSDIDKVYLGVEHPARVPKGVTIPAAKFLRVFFHTDMDSYDRLFELSYKYGRVSKIEETLQVANANGSPSIEFRGHLYITAIELVNSLNGLILNRLNDIRLNAKKWIVADKQNEITEDWLRQDIESILTVYESVKDIDHRLIKLVKSRLTIEQAGCKRWIYARYGFPESPEKTHQQPQFIMPSEIEEEQPEKQTQKYEFSIDDLCDQFEYSRDGLNPYILKAGELVAERGKPSLSYSLKGAIKIAQAIIDKQGNSKTATQKALVFIENHSQERN
ncbi:hypothetical protein [Gimesia fumaroli]|uniref:Uncharacterized protein n=1 Tax=Gimesia fumaroli TaxID=2527976 RepID=A0A518II80_9PLAN|nr:hypothetical protein [Gimesia fumaroli]QDV52781.1 hypothetical protein Enr17x_48490 [Gimesia fumaroli]